MESGVCNFQELICFDNINIIYVYYDRMYIYTLHTGMYTYIICSCLADSNSSMNSQWMQIPRMRPLDFVGFCSMRTSDKEQLTMQQLAPTIFSMNAAGIMRSEERTSSSMVL